jgi:hypothetical protein
MVKHRFIPYAAILLALAVIACGRTASGIPKTPSPAPTPLDAPAKPVNPSSSPTATPEPIGVWIQPGVPQSAAAMLAPLLADPGYVEAPEAEGASVRLVLDPPADAPLVARWVMVPVAPFPTVPDDVSWEALGRFWQGDLNALAAFGPPRLVLTNDVANLFWTVYGPHPDGVPVEVVPAEQLLDHAWQVRPAISIVPFEGLEPRWKVLALDGRSALDKSLDVESYPLALKIGLIGEGDGFARAVEIVKASGAWQDSNRDPSRITVLVMTGVTALTRATAWQIDLNGTQFPAEQIKPFFADADILHTSNEVAFATDCPKPDPNGDTTFCAKDAYYPVLEDAGFDIIELTGNHVNDWGWTALGHTLDLYDASGLAYYGGGRDLEDAIAPRILTGPDGTRLAFLGCNPAGPYQAWAAEASPGAAPCGENFETLIQQIQAARAEADLVIVTLQYWELPHYAPTSQQVEDFQKLSAAGADIVSGSQAHQPQGFAFHDGAFIHYGVGNLFFDQMDFIENRQMFADKHVIYQGRHISTVLFTGLMESWSQPNPMTPEERAEFLALIFQASGW